MKPDKSLEALRERIEEYLASEYGRDTLTKERANKLYQIAQKYADLKVKEILENIAELPRWELTHPDGSKSKVILEHSLETHGLKQK